MSADDFFATPAVPAASSTSAVSVSPFTPVPRPAPAPTRSPFPMGRVLAGGVLLLALLVGLAVVLWPHSGSNKPDTGMARLFGQQTRGQLPQPVEPDDCAAAVRAFPTIARDTAARAAFVDGCLHP